MARLDGSAGVQSGQTEMQIGQHAGKKRKVRMYRAAMRAVEGLEGSGNCWVMKGVCL